jgi:hypothetical protein
LREVPKSKGQEGDIFMRTHLSAAIAAALLACALGSAADAAAPQKPHALYLVIPKDVPWHHALPNHRPGAQLTQWNGSFVDHLGQTVNYTMVGTDPNKTNVTSKTPVVLVPVIMVYGVANGNMTFDPTTTKVKGRRTVVKNTLVSPLFKKAIDYVQGGTDLGTTQYIDAFQRGNFWSAVSTHTGYHTLLGAPLVEPAVTYNVPVGLGSVEANPFGSGNVGTMEVDVFDQQVQTWLAQISDINPGVLPIFLTYNVYLTEPGGQLAYIGGYHSAISGQPAGQTYSYATYVDSVGAFAQDVSALSHEIGEWEDDPFTDNDVNCADNTLMEDGDPLENNANYGAFPYTHKGFTYNLQSLVFIGYFGADPNTSVHSWLSFQNDEQSVCPGQ